MMMPGLTLEPERHEYAFDGVRVPGVSEVLRDAGLVDASWFTEEARQRGKAVHEATADDDRGNLFESALDPIVLPYLEAWRTFRRETGFVADRIEEMVYDPLYRYAGTLDRTGQMQGRDVLIDIKSGPPARWVALQTAAYARLVGGEPLRMGVRLDDAGRYHVTKYEGETDEQVFLAALALHNWKGNGGKP